MVTVLKGNLLESEAEGLVNTVNTVGVMGKGIALQFKKQYPENYKVYNKACKGETFTVGQVLSVWDQNVMGKKCILNFPTKRHWRSPSKYEYIASGLPALRAEIIEQKLKSVAIPPLGCGNGGLEWSKVRPMIEEALMGLEVAVFLYEPNPNIQKQLKEKAPATPISLTVNRAMLLRGMYAYEKEGEPINLVVANKIVYFLQRLGQDMKLGFTPYIYGPYNPVVSHVMAYFNGSYILGLEDMSAKPFDALQLNYNEKARVYLNGYIDKIFTSEQQEIVRQLERLIDGFSSAMGIELLSSVDYILQEQPDASVPEIVAAAGKWSNRKKKLLDERHVKIAHGRLKEFQGASLFV
jgi:O-acetyl-ADP-ribose deacetylase (regulator of RNase III)